MNPELENLVELSMADGYITDKELKVLRNKAQKLGFDLDELEVILDAKLYKKNLANKPKINKCPSCGEVLSWKATECPACNYTLPPKEPAVQKQTVQPQIHQPVTTKPAPVTPGKPNVRKKEHAQITRATTTQNKTNDSADEHKPEQGLSVLKKDIRTLSFFSRPSLSSTVSAMIPVLLTGGFFYIYKRFIKYESLYYSQDFFIDEAKSSFDKNAAILLSKNADDEYMRSEINELVNTRNKLIKTRNRIITWNTILVCAGFAGLLLLMLQVNKVAHERERVKQNMLVHKTDSLINAQQPFTAERLLDSIKDERKRLAFAKEINIAKIDSLSNAGDYDGALAIANMLEEKYKGHEEDRDTKIEEVITKQVNELIEAKEFAKARERAKLLYYNTELEDKIDLAEQINK